MLIEASPTWSFWPTRMFCVALLVYCFVFRCSKRKGSKVLFHDFSDTYILQPVGTQACLNSTPALLFSPSCACLSNGGMRVVHICVSGVCAPGAWVCVCVTAFAWAPTAEAPCRSCSGTHLRLVSTPISSSLLFKSAETISSPFQPTFPTHIFPLFFPPPMPARTQRPWLTQELRGGELCKMKLTMRCRLEMCVSGMKSTGWVTWSSRVWKKVHSLLIELLTMDLFAGENHWKVHGISLFFLMTAFRGSHHRFKLTGIILSSPFASLPLLISHLSLCTLRRKQRCGYTLKVPGFCFVHTFWWKRPTLSQKILTWQAALCIRWLVPELTS